MMNIRIFILAIAFLFCAGTGQAKVVLPRLISEGMVLQRDKPIRIWGWGNPAEPVRINFNGKTYQTTVSAEKTWWLTLPSMKAGGPYTMVIKGENEITLKDILIGDVWLCSGQSNMSFNMDRVKDKYAREIAGSTNSKIRQFRVPGIWGFSSKNDVQTDGWKSADPKTLIQFTAVGYFFAKSLFEKYQVPIGIINTSYGGSKAEAWLSDEAIQSFPEKKKEADYFKDPANVAVIVQKDKALITDWLNQARQNDLGFKDQNSWAALNTDTAAWKNITIPGYWESRGGGKIDGVVWFRKQIYLSKEDAGKNAMLLLGYLDDRDSTWFNGRLVGTSLDKYAARRYRIPATLLKPGMNVITVRITDTEGSGGFIPGKEYELISGNTRIPLSGDWKFRIGAVCDPLPVSKLTKWYLKPTSLYHPMIYPLVNYSIKGFLWYQGESNTDQPKEYLSLLPALIRDFRREWNEGNIPFIYVQLPNFGKPVAQPSEGRWAELRAAQTSALQLPNTGMAITHDLGEANDIHPLNKKDVGERLALVAAHVAYGNDAEEYSGPLYRAMKVSGNKIVLSFDHTGAGLISKDGKPLRYFAIAGKDEKYVWANAKIEGDKVVVWSDSVLSPVSVRYAWADNPEGANLYNKEGLPASGFRTDQ